MKYIKTFESVNVDYVLYWKITNKYPDILIIFDKLGVPEKWGSWLWNEDNHIIKEYYLFKTVYKNGQYGWSYSSSLNFMSSEPVPEYMGEIEVTEDDIEIWKIKGDSKKYNI